jgi:hypothetical protein
METSLRFLRGLFGFQNRQLGQRRFHQRFPRRRQHFLCGAAKCRGGAWAWIGVEDVTKLHAEYQARGVTFRLPSPNYDWALEMQEDADRNVLRFGSEPLGRPLPIAN